MAETFGVADIKIKVRLDELKIELDQAERMIAEQQGRIDAARQQTIQSFQVANASGGGDDGGGLLGVASAAGGALLKIQAVLHLLGRVRSITTAILTIARVALPTAIAAIALAVSGVAIKLVEAAKSAKDFGAELIGSLRDLDGSTASIEKLAGNLDKLPIAGRLAGFAMRTLGGTAETSARAWMSLAATVEDGEVKLRGWARAASHFVPFANGMRKEIDALNESMAETKRRTEDLKTLANDIGNIGDSAAGMSQSAARDRILSELDGVDRLAAAENMRLEDVKTGYDNLIKRTNELRRQRLDAIEAERVAGQRTQAEADRASAMAVAAYDRELERLRAMQAEAVENARAAGQARVDAYQAEAAEKSRIDAEQQREREAAEAQSRGQRIDDLNLQAETTRLRTEGRDFEAEVAEESAKWQRLIGEAMAAGDDQLVTALMDAGSARLDFLRSQQEEEVKAATERAAAVAKAEADQRERETKQQAVTERQLMSQKRQAEMQLAGDTLGARVEAIRSSAEAEIQQLMDEGREDLARLAGEVRDLNIARAVRDAGTQRVRAGVVDVGQSRIGAGGSGNQGSLRVDGIDRMNATLEQIEENTQATDGSAFA